MTEFPSSHAPRIEPSLPETDPSRIARGDANRSEPGDRGLIAMTGGGTAGHVMPNLALLPALQAQGFRIAYIASESGPERAWVEAAGLPFTGIATGKLRRYFAWKNFTDPFRVLLGFLQAFRVLGKERPRLLLSKGGFVAVPVVWAAWLRGIPVVAHESDLSPGLATRLTAPCARRVAVAFEETTAAFPSGKAVVTGIPVRPVLLRGDARRGMSFLGWLEDPAKPVIAVMGGSLGSQALNRRVREALPLLLSEYRMVHLCGRGGLDPTLEGREGYRQFEFLGDELPDVLAAASAAVTRAGATALFECLALKLPQVLVPLPLSASRGDQIENARSFAAKGWSKVLEQEAATPEALAEALKEVLNPARGYLAAMAAADAGADGSRLLALIDSHLLPMPERRS